MQPFLAGGHSAAAFTPGSERSNAAEAARGANKGLDRCHCTPEAQPRSPISQTSLQQLLQLQDRMLGCSESRTLAALVLPVSDRMTCFHRQWQEGPACHRLADDDAALGTNERDAEGAYCVSRAREWPVLSR